MAPSPPDRSPSGDKDARKRVAQACDRCRLKKIKCDGNIPCNRCRSEDAVCHFGARRRGGDRPVPSGYIDQLELQQKILVKALKVTWKTYVMDGDPTNVDDVPPVHTIVEKLGILSDPASQFGSQDALGFDDELKDLQIMATFDEMFFDDSVLSESPGGMPVPLPQSAGSSSRSGSGVNTLDMQAALARTMSGTSSNAARSSGRGSAQASGHPSPKDAPELTRGMQYFNVNEPASAPEFGAPPLQHQRLGMPSSLSMSQIAEVPQHPRPRPPRRGQIPRGMPEEVSQENWNAWINEDPK